MGDVSPLSQNKTLNHFNHRVWLNLIIGYVCRFVLYKMSRSVITLKFKIRTLSWKMVAAKHSIVLLHAGPGSSYRRGRFITTCDGEKGDSVHTARQLILRHKCPGFYCLPEGVRTDVCLPGILSQTIFPEGYCPRYPDSSSFFTDDSRKCNKMSEWFPADMDMRINVSKFYHN